MDQPTESVVIPIRIDGASAYDPDAGVDAIATTIPSFCRGCNASTAHNDIPAIQRAWRKFEEVESSASWEEIIVKGGIGPWDRIKAARDAADAEVVRAEAHVEELTKALEIARSKRECAVERLKGADDYLEKVVGTVASDSGRLEEKFAEMTSGGIDLYNLWRSCPTGMPYKMIDRIDKRLHDVFDTLQSTTHITGKSYEYPADAPQLSRPAVAAIESSNTTAEQSNTRTPTPSEKNSGNNQDRRRGKGKNNKKRRNDSRAQPYPTSAKQHRGTKQGAAIRSELPKKAEPTTNVKREVAEEPTTSVSNQSKPSTTNSGPVQHLQTLVKQEDAQLDQIPFKTETRAQPLEGMGSSGLSCESEFQRVDQNDLRHIAGGANQTSNGIDDGGADGINRSEPGEADVES
ncbi:hypothetical protein RB213_009986 [Colletotrichum asianum]|uniref:Uncharacterized protein n=1 Tax=Colletotrichum asianum TaxID=702518 RepID=A0A8H3ZLV5_9PEZI|nr:hypothetical protein GQ607_008123 [Colletotrichum asianum]